MNKLLLTICVVILCIYSQNVRTQVLQDWVFRDSINNLCYISGNYMKTDNSGNTYLVNSLDSIGSNNYTVKNIWLAEKINSLGNLVWRNIIRFPLFPGGSGTGISSIYLDANGNLFILGSKKFTGDLYKPHIIKIGNSGTIDWTLSIDSASTVSYSITSKSMANDNSNNIYFLAQGNISNSMNFLFKISSQGYLIRSRSLSNTVGNYSYVLSDPLEKIFLISSGSPNNGYDLFVQKVDTAFNTIQHKYYYTYSPNSLTITNAKFDKLNNIYISFFGNVAQNAFLIKVNTNCDTIWTKNHGSGTYSSFDFDDSSNVYFKIFRSGNNHYKYNTSNQLIWTKNTYLTSGSIVNQILVDKNGNSYLADSSLYRYNLNGIENYHFLMNPSIGFTIHDNIIGIDTMNNLFVSGIKMRNLDWVSRTQVVLNKYKQLIPLAPTLLSPSNGSYSVSLNPLLDWSDVSVNNYRVQISANSGFSSFVLDTTIGTASQLTVPNYILVYNTQYYWRVSAINEIGIGPWSSIWNFTTILQTPTLISPINGASSVTLTPLIDWSDVSGATSYNLQVATNPGFSTPVIDLSSLPSSQYQVPSGILQANTLYYWRVSASNSNGTSAWATAWNFTTLASPNTPNLISPTNGSNILTLTPTLDWSDVSGALSYTVQVSTDTNFINLAVNQSGLTVSQYTVTSGALTGNTTYYWRARAENGAGSGPWSVRWYFRVVTLPPAPNLVAPPNNSTNQSPTVTLDWDSLASANTYRIQLATDSLFNSVVYDTSGVSRSYLQMRPGILLANVKYYWKVNATNLAGTGPWSVIWNFRVNPTGLYQYTSSIPNEFKLHYNYPNPFNPITKIRFDIPKNTYVQIRIFDLTGKEIMKLINENLSSGAYEVLWNANNYSSGVYFYRIETESFIETKRMLLVK